MELEIQIVRDPCRDLSKQRLRVFGETGGTIGRAPDADWALPDPKSYVSGHHCDVEYHGDAFWLRDTSRNGVFLNDAQERIGYGHRVRLDDGDHLRLGLYELVVKLRDHGRHIAKVRDGAETTAAPVLQLAAVGTATSDLPLSTTGSHRLVKFDRVALRAIGLLPPESQERLVQNQFRHIKRALIANAFGKGVAPIPNGHLLMMTSALPGEGKTFSTINLALSLAREKDFEVLVVDADVAKPQISGLLKVEQEPGLLEALTDESIDVESLVLRTDVKGLSILPAGRCDEDTATELLASGRMQAIVARLGARSISRIVLFDSPPLLLTNESRVIATVVGQIVMVVRAGVTPQPAVLEAIGFLGEGKPIGLVLNQSKANAPGSYYGYGAYGYGAYGSAPGDSNTSKNR
jgi:receptor protein-tyrosine kinase